MDKRKDVTKPRTDVEIHSRLPEVITMGGVEYAIKPQPIRAAMVASQKLADLLSDLDDLFGVLVAAASSGETDWQTLPLDDAFDSVVSLLSTGFPKIVEILCDYVPEIANDRDRIEETAMPEELIPALIAVIKLIYGPFVKNLPVDVAKTTNAAIPVDSERSTEQKAG